MTLGAPSSFFRAAVIYAILGMLLGAHMAASQDHGQMVTHAHLMLIGWVSLFLYGVFLKLHPSVGAGRSAALWWIGNVGTIVTVIGLFVLYGGDVALGEPLATLGSLTVLVGMGLFGFLVWTAKA